MKKIFLIYFSFLVGCSSTPKTLPPMSYDEVKEATTGLKKQEAKTWRFSEDVRTNNKTKMSAEDDCYLGRVKGVGDKIHSFRRAAAEKCKHEDSEKRECANPKVVSVTYEYQSNWSFYTPAFSSEICKVSAVIEVTPSPIPVN